MDRNKTIVKNTIIFFIGNFGSKVLSFVMVLVYTHYITTSALGYYDLILTTVSLVQPIVTMAFDEGIYRWMIDDSYKDKRTIVTTCLKITSVTTLGAIAVLFLLNFKFHFQYVLLIALYLASVVLYAMFLNAVRGLSNNKLYAMSGVLNSIAMLVLEILGLMVFNMGVEALLFANLASNLIAIAYIYLKQKELHGILKESFDRVLAKKIFNYSMPLVPNQISWWIVNSSDRYIILFFLGTSFNGIYSVSNKFPTIITTITGIVYLALQQTIIKEYNSPDRDDFYSKTFKNYYVLLFCLVMCAVPATKVIILWFVSESYIEAWKFIGSLYMSTIFSALSSFLGIGYQISRETKRSVTSTAAAAAVNIGVNVALIRSIGLHAASISTFAAYFFLFSIRIAHSKKYFSLRIKWPLFIALNIISWGIIVTSYLTGIVANIVITVCATIIASYVNKDMLKKILSRRRQAA